MVEKLLTNWMSICLYAFVRVREGPAALHPGGSGPSSTKSPAGRVACPLMPEARPRPTTCPVYSCLSPEALTAHTLTGLCRRASLHALPRD